MSSKQQNEVVFDLDAAAFSSDAFRIYSFKVGVRGLGLSVARAVFVELILQSPGRHLQVKRCPRARPHDWTQVWWLCLVSRLLMWHLSWSIA